MCLQVAGWLPEDLVEGGIKRLLFLARENPATRLLVLDVSMRKEWIREDADTVSRASAISTVARILCSAG